MLRLYIRQLRPKSWLKNVFVFIPLVFSLTLTDLVKLTATAVAFVSFCLISSAVYIFNDIRDIESDRKHPVKCRRPVASGAIGVRAATVTALLLSAAALGLAYCANLFTALMLAIYLAENLLYTIVLKHHPIYDCFCIAAGFILRVYAGSFAGDEPVSDWLFLTIVAMSLFMAFGKRRGEMLKIDEENRRVVLERYNLVFLNGIMFCTAGLSIVFYSLWAMNRGAGMIYTVPIIIFIVCKYLLIIHDEKSHGDPTTVIFADKTLMLAGGAYAVLTMLCLYFGRTQ
jgi:4-hydroxybenzoate polyprenyltransferase